MSLSGIVKRNAIYKKIPCKRSNQLAIDKPPKSLILKAGYSSMATLIFEYNVLPFLPILAPIKRFPQLERKSI